VYVGDKIFVYIIIIILYTRFEPYTLSYIIVKYVFNTRNSGISNIVVDEVAIHHHYHYNSLYEHYVHTNILRMYYHDIEYIEYAFFLSDSFLLLKIMVKTYFVYYYKA